MIYLVNPPGGKRKSATRKSAGTRTVSAAQKRARAAFVKKFGSGRTSSEERESDTVGHVKARRGASSTKQRRKQGGTMATRKKRRRSARRVTASAAKTVVRRKRRRHAVAAHKRKGTSVRAYHQNPMKRRRRRAGGFRRNPGGIVNQVMTAAKDVGTIVVGKAATNYVSRMIPFGGTSRPMTTAKKIAVALGLSMVARRVASQRVADLILAGGLLGPVEDFAATLPVIGTALRSDVDVASAVGSYVDNPGGDIPFIGPQGTVRYSELGTGRGNLAAYAGRPGVSSTGGGY